MQRTSLGVWTVFLYIRLLTSGIHSQLHVHQDWQEHGDCVLCLHAHFIAKGEFESLPSFLAPSFFNPISVSEQNFIQQILGKLYHPRAPPASA